MSGPSIATEGVRRVLLRAPNWLGDTVMAVPALRALRRALPEAELWVLGPWAPALLEAEPGLGRCLEAPADWRARWAAARALRATPPDVAVLLTNSFASALEARLAGARARVGYAGDGRTPLLTHPVPPPSGRVHQVAAYLGLLEVLGVADPPTPPRLHVAPARHDEAGALARSVGVTATAGTVAIQLGAALGPSKLWPEDRLAALAAALERDGRTVVFLGGPTAGPLLAAVARARGAPVRSLVGRDHPALLPALLARFAVLVSPDSGPAHVAAAVGVPVVTLFGPTDPRLTAPLGPGHATLWRRPTCGPCFLARCPIDHRCLHGLEVEEVLAAVREVSGARPGA
jgi:heptosyltransferase-2